MKLAMYLSCPSSNGAGLYYATYPIFQKLIKKTSVSTIVLCNQEIKEKKDDYKVWCDNLSLPTQSGLLHAINHFRKGSEQDITHLHGLWGSHSLGAYLYSIRKNKGLVISPHGMLDKWALEQSKYKKSLSRLIYENKLWGKANYFHALNSNEALSIRELLPTANVVIIPNGVDIPYYKKIDFSSKRKILFLGRLHRKKGIYELLSAWSALYSKLKNNIELHIAGWGDIDIQEKLKNMDGVVYHGAVHGEKKKNLLEICDGFILPSFSEGLPMTVLEAWSYGIPVMMSKACNLDVALKSGFAMEVDPSVDSIKKQLEAFAHMPNDELLALSELSLDFVRKNYDWSIIAEQHYELYNELKHKL